MSAHGAESSICSGVFAIGSMLSVTYYGPVVGGGNTIVAGKSEIGVTTDSECAVEAVLKDDSQIGSIA